MALTRPAIIAGNWKMHKTVAEAQALARELKDGLPQPLRVEVVVAPPFTALAAVRQVLAGSPIHLAAQDVFWEKEGAFTGAISPVMLTEIGCRFVIIGHSERRQYFQETDATVNRKVKAALAAGLRPIVCIGETLHQREAGETLEVVKRQLTAGLAGLLPKDLLPLVLAYEPVWAIGTGRNATPEQAQEVHAFIRELVGQRFAPAVALNLPILYGGSVTPNNIRDLIQEQDIDGALVGGASLKADSFLKIVALGE